MKKAVSFIFRQLTQNEFKAITNTINSEGGGSQTYIDFPKGKISDENLQEFFNNTGTVFGDNGYEWKFKVNSLSLGRIQQEETISARRSSSNSLREQNKDKRIEIWKNERSGFPVDAYDEGSNPIIIFILKDEDSEYWAGWFYRNQCNDSWFMSKGLSSVVWTDCGYVKFDCPIPFNQDNYEWPFANKFSKPTETKKKTIEKKADYLTALRTKPFLLLGGISGTGKSRIVRELAYRCCSDEPELRENDAEPGNYCMIEVKPNWHDSTDLLGYYSNVRHGYVFTKFVNFLVKAMQYPDVPFFVCLDEMNLAPVEHYFAEYLSVLETRKTVKGEVTSGVLVDKQYFKFLAENVVVKEDATEEEVREQLNIIKEQHDQRELWFGSMNENKKKVQDELVKNGLRLPENVFVVGTVNMDDTTHSFSRKVIDRAMVIEMNGGELMEMFGHSGDLEYLKEGWLTMTDFRPQYVNADEVLADYAECAEILKEDLVGRLNKINEKLKDTPFVVSYRVLNELVIYAAVLIGDDKTEENVRAKCQKAVDDILMRKILPRIEGDEQMLGTGVPYNIDGDNVNGEGKLFDLYALAKEEKYEDSQKKLLDMCKRLNRDGVTRFWP